MIRKLRIKLILASMLSLLLVLAVILGIAGVLNYRKIISDADSILAILQENDGSFPSWTHTEGTAVSADARPKEDRRFSPELPYESRYFSVFLDKNGARDLRQYRKDRRGGYRNGHRLCTGRLPRRAFPGICG